MRGDRKADYLCDGAVGLRCEIALNFLRNRRVKYIYEYYKWVNTGGFNVTVRKQQVMLNSSGVLPLIP